MLKWTNRDGKGTVFINGNRDDLECLKNTLLKFGETMRRRKQLNQRPFVGLHDLLVAIETSLRMDDHKDSFSIQVGFDNLLLQYTLMRSLFDYTVTDELDEVVLLLLRAIVKSNVYPRASTMAAVDQ